MKILKEELFRSSPNVNVTDNMVRVTFVCSRNEWRNIKLSLLSSSIKGDKEIFSEEIVCG